MDKYKLEKLEELLERIEKENDPDMVAVLKWAIFTLENM